MFWRQAVPYIMYISLTAQTAQTDCWTVPDHGNANEQYITINSHRNNSWKFWWITL